MIDTNVGIGIVPHRKSCRCDECYMERLIADGVRLKARIKALEQALEYLSDSAKYDVTVTRYARAALLQGSE